MKHGWTETSDDFLWFPVTARFPMMPHWAAGLLYVASVLLQTLCVRVGWDSLSHSDMGEAARTTAKMEPAICGEWLTEVLFAGKIREGEGSRGCAVTLVNILLHHCSEAAAHAAALNHFLNVSDRFLAEVSSKPEIQIRAAERGQTTGIRYCMWLNANS